MARKGRKRTPDQIERDRARTAELKLKGFSQTEIAKELGLSKAQITYDLKQIRREWQESRIRDFDMLVTEELAHINNLHREYWRNYLMTTQKRVVMEDPENPGKKLEKIVRIPGQKKYLEGVQWCIEQRCRIEGIYAAINANLTLHSDKAMEEADKLSDAELNKRLQMISERIGLLAGDANLSIFDIKQFIKDINKTEPPGNGKDQSPGNNGT